MLAHHLRRRTNIKTTLIQCIVFAGMASLSHGRHARVIADEARKYPHKTLAIIRYSLSTLKYP